MISPSKSPPARIDHGAARLRVAEASSRFARQMGARNRRSGLAPLREPGCVGRGVAGRAMIGIVLVTHGRLATEFLAALEHVVGPQKQIAAIDIGPEDDVEQRRLDIIAAVRQVDDGEGVALLTDMFGGTPSNLAISVMNGPTVEVVAGINLPMLVKLARLRSELPLPEAVLLAQEAGRKYINIASRVLSGQ